MRNRSRNQQGTAALALAVLTENPRQALTFTMGMAAVGAVFINALFLQPISHPAPLFVGKSAAIATPSAQPPVQTAAVRPVGPDATLFVPRPRPVEAPTPVKTQPAGRPDPIAELIAARPEPRTEIKRTAPSVASTPVAAPPQPVPNPATQRIAAAQRALTEFGYGQVKPTGVAGPETQSAIERFERERGLAVSGQLSDRVLREISIATGRKLD